MEVLQDGISTNKRKKRSQIQHLIDVHRWAKNKFPESAWFSTWAWLFQEQDITWMLLTNVAGANEPVVAQCIDRIWSAVCGAIIRATHTFCWRAMHRSPCTSRAIFAWNHTNMRVQYAAIVEMFFIFQRTIMNSVELFLCRSCLSARSQVLRISYTETMCDQ